MAFRDRLSAGRPIRCRGGGGQVGDDVAHGGVAQGGGQAGGHDRGGAGTDLLDLIAADGDHLGVGVGDLDRVGALGADDSGEDPAVPGGYGVRGVIGLDRRAGGGDVAVDVRPALGRDLGEVRVHLAAFAAERVA